MAIAGVLAAALPPLRSGARRLADSTPLLWFTWLQALRIAALGTLVKTAAGTFPPHFGLLVGVPDFLFGLSALAVARLQRDGRISPRRVGLWHALGCAVVALPAGPLIQAGLPGPLEVFRGSEALLVYPMALAPTLVVPLLVMVNAWIAFHLLVARGREPSV